MSSTQQSSTPRSPRKKANKIFGEMTKRRWFGVWIFLTGMLWFFKGDSELEKAIINNRFYKDGATYDYSTIRFEGDISLIDSLFRRGFFPNTFTWQVGSYFNWTEGPILTNEGVLLFSDVTRSRIYSYTQSQGISIEVENSGDCTEDQMKTLVFPGSDGLILHPTNPDIIFITQHCSRRIISYNLITKEKKVIASEYNGKPLNSPNDLALGPKGKYIYFTDPPYGFTTKKDPLAAYITNKKNALDFASDLGFSGIFRVSLDGGEIELLDDSMFRPNGLAFSTDFSRLFVTNSLAENYEIHVYDVNNEGKLQKSSVWGEEFLLRNSDKLESKISQIQGGDGVIDGLTVHPSGYLIVTSPGAKLCIIDERTGDLKAVIKMVDLLRVSNAVVGHDEYLYVTGNHTVWQLKLQPFDNQTPKSDI